ncbi:hypothetical protein JCM3775_003040 [Rhodotorula graminis]
MAPLAAFVAHLAAVASSPAPPASLFVHVPGDADHLARTVTVTLEHAVTDHRAATARDRPSVDTLLPRVASLDLARAYSTKAAFDSILDQLSAWTSAHRNGHPPWDDRDKGIPAWHGSLDRLKVVHADPHRRNSSGERPPKRARTARRASVDSSDDGGERREGDDGPRWVLEWDDDAPVRPVDKPALAPLRNTVDAFHHSLRAIFALSPSPPVLPSAASSALDPAADLAPRDDHGPAAPARRFIVVEHGELLGELAGGTGGASGAARETGVGVTFASTLHRLADLTGLPITVVTISRLPWHKLRESMVGLPSPELLSVDDMTSTETVALLTSRFASSPASHPTSSDSLSHAQLVELFRSLAYVVKSTFGGAVTEVDELAFMCARLWRRWKDVRERSNPPIAPTDTARLSIALRPEFAAELERLFLPRPTLASLPPVGLAAAQGPNAHHSTSSAAPTSALGFTGTIAAPPKQPTYLDSPSSSSAARLDAGAPGSNDGADSGDFFAARAAQAFASPARPGPSAGAVDPFFAAGPAPSMARTASSSSRAGAAAPAVAAAAAAAAAAAPASAATLAKSLPLAARYLLLAAYFAAHNPPKSDVRMFVRVDETEGVARKGKKAKRKGGGAKAGGKGSPKKNAAALSGGKPFALERLVALFDAVLDSRLEYALGTPAVLALVQALVQLRLLTRASAQDKVLDGVKLRCAIERDEAEGLAVSLGWKEWKERLVGVDD